MSSLPDGAFGDGLSVHTHTLYFGQHSDITVGLWTSKHRNKCTLMDKGEIILPKDPHSVKLFNFSELNKLL